MPLQFNTRPCAWFHEFTSLSAPPIDSKLRLAPSPPLAGERAGERWQVWRSPPYPTLPHSNPATLKNILCLPFPVEAMRHRKSGELANIGSAAAQIALLSSWKANSSRIKSPENPRAVRGFAASTLIRPTL